MERNLFASPLRTAKKSMGWFNFPPKSTYKKQKKDQKNTKAGVLDKPGRGPQKNMAVDNVWGWRREGGGGSQRLQEKVRRATGGSHRGGERGATPTKHHGRKQENRVPLLKSNAS